MQVLDHEDETSVKPVGRFQDSGPGAFLEFVSAPLSDKGIVCGSQFPGDMGMRVGDLPREVEERFQPEIPQVEDLMAFFHEPDRQQLPGEFFIGAYLRSSASQQHGLAPPAGTDEQDVLTRRPSNVPAKRLQHDSEFVLPYHELPDYLVVGLERSRVELADRRLRRFVHRTPPRFGSEFCPRNPIRSIPLRPCSEMRLSSGV